jgi:hypothetical protein
MNPYTTLWWTSALQTAQIGWHAPIVIGQRLLKIAASGPQPSPADQREWMRMVIEKNEAAFESAQSFWMAALHRQQQAWLRALWSGRLLAPEDFRLDRATARRLGRSLAPVTRRVKSNARRLTRRRRRSR